MSAGQIVAQGSLAEMQAQNQTYLKVVTPDADKALKVIEEFGLSPSRETKDGMEIFTSEVEHGFDGDQILRKLLRAKAKIKSFGVEQASLEDRFVDLTGEGFDVVQ
jgi:ABC-2 type transport system ATP-binding protein